MAFRFRKSVKIAPGIRLNLSKSDISTSVGKRGASVNFSKRGTRITTSIPGTGLSTSKLYKPSPLETASPEVRGLLSPRKQYECIGRGCLVNTNDSPYDRLQAGTNDRSAMAKTG